VTILNATEGYKQALQIIANGNYNDYGPIHEWAASIANAALVQTYEFELNSERNLRIKKEQLHDDYDDDIDYDHNDTSFTF